MTEPGSFPFVPPPPGRRLRYAALVTMDGEVLQRWDADAQGVVHVPANPVPDSTFEGDLIVVDIACEQRTAMRWRLSEDKVLHTRTVYSKFVRDA
jgi:hypothetical protein